MCNALRATPPGQLTWPALYEDYGKFRGFQNNSAGHYVDERITSTSLHDWSEPPSTGNDGMHKIRRVVWGLMCLAIYVPSAESSAQEARKIFSDEYVLFSYPANRYSKVRFGEVTEDGFYIYYLKVKGSDAADILTVCKANLSHCGLDTGAVKPYWYSSDGSLMLFSATTTVKKKAVDSGSIAYEAFPACPATDNEGPSAYGGDCYELVEGSRDKTLSITYWIGPKSLHRSKSNAVKQAKIILESIVVK